METKRIFDLGYIYFLLFLCAACSTDKNESADTATQTDMDSDTSSDTHLNTVMDTESETDEWITTWSPAMQLTEPGNLPPTPPGLADSTLRQVVQVSLGAKQLRFSFSNMFGDAPLTIATVKVASSTGGGGIDVDNQHTLTFFQEPTVTIPAGEVVTSDAVQWEVAPFTEIAISMLFDQNPPADVTGHPGSRTTTYLVAQDMTSAPDMADAQTVERWYFISQVDAVTTSKAKAIVIIGDSIADGYGSTTDDNDRWPNILSQRLMDNPATQNIAVLNKGAGGNCVTRECLGRPAVERFDRDALEPLGVKWVIFQSGINDLGTDSSVTSKTLIDAFTDMAQRAHAQGILTIGGTIMPCEGHDYFSNPLESKRQAFNQWVRTTDVFDAIIDFDEIARDADTPTQLSSEVNGGDGLHPDADGHRFLAQSVDLSLFQ